MSNPFGTKRKYLAFSGTSGLLDEEIAGTIPGAVKESVMFDRFSISEAVVLGSSMGIVPDSRRYVQYGRRHYIHGLPEAQLTLRTINYQEILAYLPAGATIVTVRAGSEDPDFLMYELCKANIPNWDISLDQVTLPNGQTVANEPYWVEGPAGENTVGFGDPVVWSMPGDYAFRPRHKLVIQVQYSMADGDNRFWTYEEGAGGLDHLFEVTDEYHEYMPVTVLMHDRKPFNKDPDSQLAVTTRKLMRKLKMDADEFYEKFEEEQNKPENQNQRADAWDFFLHYGVPLRTEIRHCQEYLFDYFEYLADISMYTEDDFYRWVTRDGKGLRWSRLRKADAPINQLDIQEGGEQGFNAMYRYYFAKHRAELKTPDQSGLRVGHFKTEFLPFKDSYGPLPDFPDAPPVDGDRGRNNARWNQVMSQFFPQHVNMSWQNSRDFYFDAVLITQQVSSTRMEQVLVCGLFMDYKVNTKDSGNYRYRYAEVPLIPDRKATYEDGGFEEFRIPVNLGILNDMPPIKREKVLGEAICTTVYITVVEKRRWYQRTFWKWVIIIVAIVVIVWLAFNGGWGAIQEIAEAVAFFIGVSSATIVTAIGFFLKFAIGWVISMAAIHAFGMEYGMYVAMAVMFYLGGGWQGLKNNMSSMWANTQNFANLGWNASMQYLTNVAATANWVYGLYASYEQRQLLENMEDFTQKEQEALEEIDKAWDLLENNSGLDPWMLLRNVTQIVYEEPDEFLGRTLRTNPGIQSLRAVEDFVDLALLLPRKNDVNILQTDLDQILAITEYG